MAETLGTLVDKISIINVRIWHLEDTRRDKSLPDSQRLAACDAVAQLNSDRNRLIQELDEYMAECFNNPGKLAVFRKQACYKGET